MKRTLYILIIALAATTLGCSVRGVVTSVPPRIFREVHALRVRSYQLTPVTSDLRRYRTIEVHRLENLMLDQIPEPSVKQLNAEIVKGLRSLKNFDHAMDVDESIGPQNDATDKSHSDSGAEGPESALVLEGYIDDYTPGVPELRYIEHGNNHAVLTVRIMLKDKQTATLLGEKNITVENSRITSNVRRMVEKTAKEVVSFVDRSTNHYNGSREAVSNVQ